jgi:hypothetical protein
MPEIQLYFVMPWACLNHLMEHALCKFCQYISTIDKVTWGFSFTSIKSTQVDIQKTWPKKSGKGKQAWNKACINFGFMLEKIKHTNENQVTKM